MFFGELDRQLAVLDDVLQCAFGAPTHTHAFTPAVDVWVNEGAAIFEFDVPGVKRDDIDVSVKEGTLTVSWVRRLPAVEKGHLVRRPHGSFSKNYTLPQGFHTEEGLKAELKDGVLRITIPRIPQAKSRRIPINAS